MACIRIADLRPDVDSLTGAVRIDGWSVGLSDADAAAVEHAFRIADAWSGTVTILAAAAASAEPLLRELMALGAHVMRICGPEAPGAEDPRSLAGDEQMEASMVSAALAHLGTPAVVLCGDRSPDRGTGAFPAFLAHHLKAAQALGLVSIVPDPQVGFLTVERRLDGGWRERLRVPCPSVCSVEAAGVRLRRAPLVGALDSSQREVQAISRADLSGSPQIADIGAFPPGASAGPPVAGLPVAGPSAADSIRVGSALPFRPRTRVLPPPRAGDPRLRLLELTGATLQHDPPVVVGPIDASAAADTLLEFLARRGYLPTDPTDPTDPGLAS